MKYFLWSLTGLLIAWNTFTFTIGVWAAQQPNVKKVDMRFDAYGAAALMILAAESL